MESKEKLNKGITLVALVITIIILLILAGISISALTGSGLFEKSQQAQKETENAQSKENATLSEYEQSMANYIGGNSTGGEKTLTDTDDTKPAQAMPANATVIENDLSKGIVIKDSKNNEWTWVVVPMSVTTGKTTDTDIETALKGYATNYTSNTWHWKDEYYSGCGMTETEYNTAKSRMLQSIKTYGGFWISRYEAGIKGSDTDTTKARTTHTDITDSSIEAVSQANMIPYNYVYCSEAQALAKRMSTDTSKTSSLLFGIQWDLTCRFLEGKDGLNIASINSDSTNWGNYKNSSLTLYRGKYNIAPWNSKSVWKSYDTNTPNYVTDLQTSDNESYMQLLTTGASEQTNKMNIYDFAGNEREFTLEQTNFALSPCALRGGHFMENGSSLPASHRGDNGTGYWCETTTGSNYSYGFRSALY